MSEGAWPEVAVLHRNLAVLRLADESALTELRAVIPLERYVVAEVSPLELVIDPARVRELVELVESRGLRVLIRRAGA